MEVKQAYNVWAEQYDSNANRTRDLESKALINTLKYLNFEDCLEIGCGTGKNTEWLASRTSKIISVDFSEKMLEVAKQKITSENVEFIQADITQDWNFTTKCYKLVTFSLILEHIKDLEFVYKELSYKVKRNGYVYIGELHPFKQYSGTKACFETDGNKQVVTCYNHNVSDFIQPLLKRGFILINVDEYFDNDDRDTIPRIITVLLKKI